jgi:hypothetical protein
MTVRVFAAFGLIAALAGCGGNPWIPGGESDGETVTAAGVVNGVTVNPKLKGNMNSVTYATGNNPITVDMTSQDSAALNGKYARNAAFDVAGYKAYTHQESGSNRYVVVLVADGESSAKAMIAMDAGQFSTSHPGGIYSRAEEFVVPTAPAGSGAQPTFNYSGAYAGLLNAGVNPGGGPGGDLDPTRAYRTTGRVLITADFVEMQLSGGIDNRKIVDTGNELPTQFLKDTAIDGKGNFVGITQRLDIDPTTLKATLSDSGDYAGIIAGPNGSQIAVIFKFKPLKDDPLLYEQGIFVSSNCVIANGPACAP